MFRPQAAKAALCSAGESECETGRPMIPTSLVVPLMPRTSPFRRASGPETCDLAL